METSTQMGMNRTGIQMAPQMAKSMAEEAKKDLPEYRDSSIAADELRIECSQKANALGTVPIPGSLKGIAKTALQKITGKNTEVLIDKLGERLAFERTGVRLYDAMITKYKAASGEYPEISIERLMHFRSEELGHFQMLKQTIEDLGADPTAVTPSADVTGVIGMGLPKVLNDPRTSVPQCIEAILVAELADHDGWESLINLCEELGLDSMTEKFRTALKEEEDHLSQVRSWGNSLLMKEGRAAS